MVSGIEAGERTISAAAPDTLNISHALRLSVALLLFCGMTGCQVWNASSILPGLTASKSERVVMKQAKNDPFPSPRDVGMKASE